MKTTFALTFCLFFNFFFSASQEEPSYAVSNISPQLLAGANAVLRLHKLEIHLKAQDEMTIKGTRIVTILNDKGNISVGAVLGYDRFRKIKKIEAEILNSKGEQIQRIKKRDFVDHSAVDGGTLYSDSRVLYMDYLPVSYPYTVKFSYELETPNTATIYPWHPVNGYNLSVEKSEYFLIDDANLGLRIKEKNFEGFKIDQINKPTSQIYTIENIPAFRFEELSPDISKYTPQALAVVDNFHFNGVDGQAKNWQEFGKWVNDALLSGRGEISQKTKQNILELTNEVQDPIEKAKIVYQFVQDNTRYISVQVGIGGVQPIAAIEVDQLKYGDCKGLTNYTQSLLKTVGVDSYYTIVEAGKTINNLEEDFATLQQGNHIILGIPKSDDMIWLDCTSQIHPFGFIGDFTDGRKVLVIRPEGSIIQRTTIYEELDNHQSTNAKAFLNSNGDISAKVDIETTGIQYDNRFFIERYSDRDIVKHYKSYWGYINNIDLISQTFENRKEEVAFKEIVEFNAVSYGSISGGRLIFCPNIFNRNTYVPDRNISRNAPLVIQRGYLDEDVFEIEIPVGFEVEAIPDNIQINNKFGEYVVETSKKDNMLLFKRKLFIKKGNYPKTEYKFYRDFRKDVAKHDASIVVLKQKA